MKSFWPNDPRLPRRFWAKVRVDDNGCWLWTASKFRNGYGAIKCGRGGELPTRLAHRAAYVVLVGDPGVLDLDHLCRIRHCVNPAHLEPVTRAVNLSRGVGISTKWAKRTNCEKCGGPFSIRRGVRECRPCHIKDAAARVRTRRALLKHPERCLPEIVVTP